MPKVLLITTAIALLFFAFGMSPLVLIIPGAVLIALIIEAIAKR